MAELNEILGKLDEHKSLWLEAVGEISDIFGLQPQHGGTEYFVLQAGERKAEIAIRYERKEPVCLRLEWYDFTGEPDEQAGLAGSPTTGVYEAGRGHPLRCVAGWHHRGPNALCTPTEILEAVAKWLSTASAIAKEYGANLEATVDAFLAQKVGFAELRKARRA